MYRVPALCRDRLVIKAKVSGVALMRVVVILIIPNTTGSMKGSAPV